MVKKSQAVAAKNAPRKNGDTKSVVTEKSAITPKPATKSKASRAWSGREIGMVAGDIWKTLDAQGEVSLAALKKSIDASSDLIVAAIGWLAREDKLDMQVSGRTIKVKLR